jgi:uncharacterized protein (TIGR02996 family)
MNEDEAFICAIRAAPDDETARLIYADWLDERSDPRGEYLRTEAAWVALPHSDEQYRPLCRRVSQLAAALDPEWFAVVSRMGHLARREWESVAHVWAPQPRERTTESVPEWGAIVKELNGVFDKYVGTHPTQRRFCVPVDYLAFLTTFGGGWQADNWHELAPARAMCQWSSHLCGKYGGNEPDERLEMWLCIGAAGGDIVLYMLCCDLDCPRFGEVAEDGGYHPWMEWMGSPCGSAPLHTRGNTFLQFLVNWSSGWSTGGWR